MTDSCSTVVSPTTEKLSTLGFPTVEQLLRYSRSHSNEGELCYDELKHVLCPCCDNASTKQPNSAASTKRNCHTQPLIVEPTAIDDLLQKLFEQGLLLPNITPSLAVPPLETAPVVIGGGYGVGSKDNFEQLQHLAQLLQAPVGATRPAIDAGWATQSQMIGSTGRSIRPKLYIAFGICGAVQHCMGIDPNSVVVSVNTDPNAPINRRADYVVVADAAATIAAMTDFLHTKLPHHTQGSVTPRQPLADPIPQQRIASEQSFFCDNNRLNLYLSHHDVLKATLLREQNFVDSTLYPHAPSSAAMALQQSSLVLSLIGEVAAGVIAPNAASADVEGSHLEEGTVTYSKPTQQNHNLLTALGLYGVCLPRQYGGYNLGYVANVMAAEMIARGDANFANIWGLQACAETLLDYASDEVKARFLHRIHQGATCSMDLTEPEAGSDLQAVKMQATWDETSNCWRLNGVKRFITNGGADIHLVLARSEHDSSDGRGLSLFVCDYAEGGIQVRRLEQKLGIHASPTAELQFNNAPAYLVGERRVGLIKYVMSLMNGARLGVGAQAVGIAEAAYREAVLYGKQREQFGHPVADFPQVKTLLADMEAQLAAMRSLLYATARHVDIVKAYQSLPSLSAEQRKDMKQQSRMADALTPMVKLINSEWANRVAYNAVQLHGGSGYMQDYACERLYRDARVLSLYEGTSQMQVVAIQKGILNGTYRQCVEDYEAQYLNADNLTQEHAALHHRLGVIADEWREMLTIVEQEPTPLDERRISEATALVVMGYNLLLDSMRDPTLLPILRHYLRLTQSEMAAHRVYCSNAFEN